MKMDFVAYLAGFIAASLLVSMLLPGSAAWLFVLGNLAFVVGFVLLEYHTTKSLIKDPDRELVYYNMISLSTLMRQVRTKAENLKMVAAKFLWGMCPAIDVVTSILRGIRYQFTHNGPGFPVHFRDAQKVVEERYEDLLALEEEDENV